eukprot:SAG11_NODE_282_length_11247_cov_11.050323_3_plen_85_part_00
MCTVLVFLSSPPRQELMDCNRTGVVSASEFDRVLRRLDIRLSAPELRAAVGRLNADAGYVDAFDYASFCRELDQRCKEVCACNG